MNQQQANKRMSPAEIKMFNWLELVLANFHGVKVNFTQTELEKFRLKYIELGKKVSRDCLDDILNKNENSLDNSG